MSTKNKAIKELWYNNRVKRYHTTPMNDRQTNADHCWGVTMIILMLHPNPSLNLLRVAMFHDSAEAITGDVPYTIREQEGGQEVRAGLEILEKIYLNKLLTPTDLVLTQDEVNWFMAADMLELIMYCTHEVLLGNTYAGTIVSNGTKYLVDKIETPPEIQKAAMTFLEEIINDIRK